MPAAVVALCSYENGVRVTGRIMFPSPVQHREDLLLLISSPADHSYLDFFLPFPRVYDHAILCRITDCRCENRLRGGTGASHIRIVFSSFKYT